MTIVEATKLRIEELCNERGLNFCRLATISGVPYTTVKSIIYNQSKNPSITTIKKICDGLDISIADFFDTDTFRNLEQEIKWLEIFLLSLLYCSSPNREPHLVHGLIFVFLSEKLIFQKTWLLAKSMLKCTTH